MAATAKTSGHEAAGKRHLPAKKAFAKLPAASGLKGGSSPRRFLTWSKTAALDVFRLDPLDRVTIAKGGVPAAFVQGMAQDMGIPRDRLVTNLGMAPATVSRKVQQRQVLSPDQSERALGMARLVGQVQSMVSESGDPEGFDAAAWLANWLDGPLEALGGRKPAQLLDTSEGQAIVSNLLARMQSGAYA